MEVTESTPILRALRFVEAKSTAEVRVHVVQNRFEKDAMDSALRIFEEIGMTRTTDRNGILIYLNRSTRKFAIVADEGVHRKLGQPYWDELSLHFREDLLSTHFENALALLVFSLGTTLKKVYPIEN